MRTVTLPTRPAISFVDDGVGGFLRGPANVNADWKQYADAFDGKFQTTTLRNTDKRPRPDFVKAYMHNGYLKSLKEVVHFYNTRDSLGTCKGEHDPGEKVSDAGRRPRFRATSTRRSGGWV